MEIFRQGLGAIKPALADLLVETLAPIRTRLRVFEADPAAIETIWLAIVPSVLDILRRSGALTCDSEYASI